MRILDRYLVRHLLIPIIFCSFTLIFLVLMADIFDHLSEFLKNKTTFSFILQYYINLIPYAFVQTIPWATFLGTIFLLVNFNAHNEILAMKVAGLNITKIVLPLLYIGFLIGIISFLVNDRLVPATFRRAEAIKEERIEQQSAQGKELDSEVKNFTYFSLNNQLYYAKSFNTRSGTLHGVIILFFDQDKKINRQIHATEAQWDGTHWRLKGVTDYETNSAGKILGDPRSYSDQVFQEMKETPKEFVKASTESTLLSYKDLKYYIAQMEKTGLQAYPEMVELQYKLSAPWNSLIMMLITIPFMTVTRKRKGIALNVLYSIGVVFMFHMTGAIALALGKSGTLPPFLSAWTNNIIFSGGSIFLMDRAND